MKNILVTGSNGYLGSKFIAANSSIYSFKTFSLLGQQLQNLEFVGVDTVLHCAALVHQKKGIPVDSYRRVNTNYPTKLAALAKKSGVKQFVFISSIAVHGENVDYVDEHTICNPTTPYGKSKLETENLLLAMSDGGFKVSIVRIPMIYGENAPGNIDSMLRLVKLFPLLPLGNINNSRTFISIQNICHALSEIIEQRKDGVFLFADDDSISTSKLVGLLSESVGRRVYLVECSFFNYMLKKIRPTIYSKLFGSLIVNSSNSQKKLNLKNPLTISRALKCIQNP
jgi:nucleoside-diphosphate-sugar epimerase